MAVPFILAGLAAAAGVAGVAKGGKAISNNSKAKELVEDAEYIYDRAKNELEIQKEDTARQLEVLGELKLKAWSEDLGKFINVFSNFKNVRLENEVNLDNILKANIKNVGDLKVIETAALKATEVLKSGVGSLGAGALAGIASYGGAMMFASASTGTAIASLSGAAATNATLAWFGGGSLAAGGLGMAGGTLVLGGIVAGPVLAVAGFIMAAKSEENLANARKTYSEAKHAVEQMGIMKDFLVSVENIAELYTDFISNFSNIYKSMLIELDNILNISTEKQSKKLINRIKKFFRIKFKIDFNLLSENDQKSLQVAWLLTQIYNAVLAAPILNNEGNIDENAEKVLEVATESTIKYLGEQGEEIVG